ncbi:LppY/LpqO family protein [Actinacidiphila soli]|uniref:LppY/LpqO family protein n=1 Tax=Actinacidiphila soli TaxID=2487275 RepID=UPI000FCA0E62|nr:LppY/LpqO family protein [Actinacidiphila soli]
MADRTLPRRRRTALAAATLATSIPLTLGTTPTRAPAPATASTPAPGIDWNAVGRAIGRPLKTEASGVHTAEWLRTDLHVVNAGVTENPGMELNAEASFHQTINGRAVMIGEVTLTDTEVDKVADRLQQGGVEITALHKHIQAETPRLWWMHYWALGDPVSIARTVYAALAQTRIPLNQKQEKEPPIALPTGALNRIIGAQGDNENGVLQYHIPVSQHVTDTRAHLMLPYLMEASTLLMFQPLGGGRAAINGDFTMTADQVNPVIKALRSHGLTIIELHNHMLYEHPRLFYLHFWKTGQATALARALRAGLDQVHAPRH